VEHRADVRLEDVEVFRRHLVVGERADALVSLRVFAIDTDITRIGKGTVIDQPESVYAASVGANAEMDSTTLRYTYTSLVTPRSVFDYDMDTGGRVLVKQDEVLGGFDPTRYETQRLWATAPDGGQIPISVLYHKGTPTNGTAPALLYGYGSYEISVDPTFSSIRLSLVDRGFVFAIAHVRGGGEMGRQWYEDGKLLAKKHTFTDFIACAEHLVAQRWTSADRLVIRGGSAGGLLMGAVVTMRPDLFHAVVAEVPFVDCLTTILDETLPLTVMEWEEWGNPVADPEVYFYMKSYSPYDNVETTAYPTMLVRAGLNDPRVSYWEPAKWVARLRDRKTDRNTIVLRTDMGAGHMGPSGRYDAWKDEAFIQAFVLDCVRIRS
jgi:oligopeptidase B